MFRYRLDKHSRSAAIYNEFVNSYVPMPCGQQFEEALQVLQRAVIYNESVNPYVPTPFGQAFEEALELLQSAAIYGEADNSYAVWTAIWRSIGSAPECRNLQRIC